MRLFVLAFIISLLSVGSVKAQTLFTYGNNAVSKDEFIKGYSKNAPQGKPDMSEAALKEYLNLYSLFKMKVKEAELTRIDTIRSVSQELNNYKSQLAKNYLSDEEMTRKLIREAYDRSLEERHVAHILIMAPMNSPSADTGKALRLIDSLHKIVVKDGSKFEELARRYSEDRGTKENGGDLGYITALQTVYPFENAVYNTAPGQISEPFRSQFGYHMVKVYDKRPASGEVQVSQILVMTPKSKGDEGLAEGRSKIKQAEAELKRGVPFAEVVKKYSEDKYSVDQKGLLPRFGVGRMTAEFEKEAFSLKKKGDISQPIQTEYGFHILKLEEKYPPGDFASQEQVLKKKVENDSRSQIAKDIFLSKAKKQAGYTENTKNYEAFVSKALLIPDTGEQAHTFSEDYFRNINGVLFTLGGKSYTQADFGAYIYSLTRGRLLGARRGVIRDVYNMYVNTKVTEYQEDQLIVTNEDFSNLMTEYRNGIMLFELMDRNVWGKASRDTAGLQAFYEQNRSKYTWGPGFRGSVYSFKDLDAMKNGLQLMKTKGLSNDDLMKELNTNTQPDALSVQKGYFEYKSNPEFPAAGLVKGTPYFKEKSEKGFYRVAVPEELYNSNTQKTFEEARGYVIADYQDYLEKTWNEELRKKYPVKTNTTVFQSMVSK